MIFIYFFLWMRSLFSFSMRRAFRFSAPTTGKFTVKNKNAHGDFKAPLSTSDPQQPRIPLLQLHPLLVYVFPSRGPRIFPICFSVW